MPGTCPREAYCVLFSIERALIIWESWTSSEYVWLTHNRNWDTFSSFGDMPPLGGPVAEIVFCMRYRSRPLGRLAGHSLDSFLLCCRAARPELACLFEYAAQAAFCRILRLFFIPLRTDVYAKDRSNCSILVRRHVTPCLLDCLHALLYVCIRFQPDRGLPCD